MPSSTSKGYPYPVDSDPLSDIAEAVMLLAAAIDSKIGITKQARGLATVPANAGSPLNTVVVDLTPYGFASTPHVQLTVSGQSGYFPHILAVSSTTLTLGVRRGDGGTTIPSPVNVRWTATT